MIFCHVCDSCGLYNNTFNFRSLFFFFLRSNSYRIFNFQCWMSNMKNWSRNGSETKRNNQSDVNMPCWTNLTNSSFLMNKGDYSRDKFNLRWKFTTTNKQQNRDQRSVNHEEQKKNCLAESATRYALQYIHFCF